jgi:hypothetical protein
MSGMVWSAAQHPPWCGAGELSDVALPAALGSAPPLACLCCRQRSLQLAAGARHSNVLPDASAGGARGKWGGSAQRTYAVPAQSRLIAARQRLRSQPRHRRATAMHSPSCIDELPASLAWTRTHIRHVGHSAMPRGERTLWPRPIRALDRRYRPSRLSMGLLDSYARFLIDHNL